MQTFRLTSILLVMLGLAACGQNTTIPDPEPQEPAYGSGDSWEDGGADTWGDSASGRGLDGEAIGDDSFTDELTRVIYFEFDSSEVGADYTDIVTRHAIQLSDNPMMSVRLEGHADERGSREYNIGLGERRAQAVRRLLMLQGVAAEQISTVSFGEERPQAYGSDEESYAMNRRVEFTYLQR